MKKLEDHLAAKAKELERVQICLQCYEVSTGVDEALSDVMDAFRSELSVAEWRSLAIVPSAPDNGVIVSRRTDYISSLYAHVFEVDREAVRSLCISGKTGETDFRTRP